MGKKRQRATQTSKGIHSQKRTAEQKAMRLEYKGTLVEDANKLNAFHRGKNVVLTIPNPNTNETNKRFIKVPAKEVWKFGFNSKKS